MNPFLITGCDDPRIPLDPGFLGQHSDFVDVDRTEEAFTRFAKDFDRGRRVLDRGRLVLVSGPTGCGKTALINRCVRWLSSDEAPKLLHHVVDARRDVDDGMPVDQRLREVSVSVVDELSGRGAVSRNSLLLTYQDEPKRVYNQLDKELGDHTFVVLILPPSGDLIEELAGYARLTRSKMLVFAETSAVGLVSRRRGGFAGPPLFLEVGPLREADGDTYARKRLADACDWPFDDPPPPIQPGELAYLLRMREAVSIGELQLALHDVYQDFIDTRTPPPMVTREHFYRYYVRLAGREGGNG